MKEFFSKLAHADIRHIVTVIYLVLCLSYIYVLAFVKVPADNKDLVNVLGGSVFGGLAIILSYYFGASKGQNQNPQA
jgi:hypothetical protein